MLHHGDSHGPGDHNFYISDLTREKAELVKNFIAEKYQKNLELEKRKKENWDRLVAKMQENNLSEQEQERIRNDALHQEAKLNREIRKKYSPSDFESIAIIGRGAFGEVRLCRWKESGEIVAIKKLKKSEMIARNKQGHVKAERDILMKANNPWVVELKLSFQDDNYLYLVMEYLSGGDLMKLLMDKDILSEDEARFYLAESILAVESVHRMNYIHRDLKPDNILIDKDGHCKLSDFGLCKFYDINPTVPDKPLDGELGESQQYDYEQKLLMFKKNRNRERVYSMVGTPDYIAPEVFEEVGYTETVDWWSLGTILFEMIVGYPPFCGDSHIETRNKVMNWRKTFHIPEEAQLSPEAVDLLTKLISDPRHRLGTGGPDEIKAHPFFKGVDWRNIRLKGSPNIRKIDSLIDTRHFDKYDEIEPWIDSPRKMIIRGTDLNLPFVGFTYKRNLESQMTESIQSLFREIDSARDKRKLNRHNSESKNLDFKDCHAATPVANQKRQRTQEPLNDRMDEIPISSIGMQKKKTPIIASNLLKNKALIGLKETKPILGLKVTQDYSKKTPLTSSTVLKKNLESPVAKKPTEKDSAASLKPGSSSNTKRQASPKTKPSGATPTMATKISKNFAQPFISKEKTPTPATTAPASNSSAANVKKIISQIKTTTTAKPKTIVKDQLPSSKSKLLDTKGDLSSKLVFKNS